MCHFVLSPDGAREQNVLHNSSNYAIPGRIWIIRDVGKLIVFLHFTGLVRIRSRIASNRSDDNIKPLRDTPHPDLPQSGEGEALSRISDFHIITHIEILTGNNNKKPEQMHLFIVIFIWSCEHAFHKIHQIMLF